MKSFLAKYWPVLIFVILVLFFFKPFFLEGRLPIPADTIVGMYHPWRDFYIQEYPNGIPFKNFLITDPIRQQYVWRHLAIDQVRLGQLPLWNPYNFSGTPLLANFQSAIFYPLNILFFILSFDLAWTILIILQPLLAGIFLYFYLQTLRLDKFSCLFGSLVFSFSGFSTAWLEWNTVLHTALWLPLILLSVDKIFISEGKKERSGLISYINISYKTIIWFGLLLFALVASFFAGHLQIFFYVTLITLFYLVARLIHKGKWVKSSILPSIILIVKKVQGTPGLIFFAALGIFFLLVTSIQWFPTLQFINLSARQFDLPNWQRASWFLPPQHLIQFLAPDFFGNPTTLNYWGEWNYGEFIGYIGILPLILALFALFWRRDKKTLFFGSVALVSLILALPSPLAKLPYQWQIPLIFTSQPTRFLFLTDFSLAILAALGLDYFLKSVSMIQFIDTKKALKEVGSIIIIFFLILGGLWIFALYGHARLDTSSENLWVARRNLILPTALFSVFVFAVSLYHILIYHIKRKALTLVFRTGFLGGMLFLAIFDLFRFGWKFTPFTNKEWLFPETETIKFLKNQPGPFRFMTTDRRIFPPNFATPFKLEDVAGYDPLYLKSYGELVASWNRDKPDIGPFSFNRILTPQDYSSRIADLLNVKYVLSLKEETSPKLKLIFQEGQTRVYENKDVLPRVFFVDQIIWVDDKESAIKTLYKKDFDPSKMAVVQKPRGLPNGAFYEAKFLTGTAEIISYSENKVLIKTENKEDGFLVLGDSFYPTWHVKVHQQDIPYSFETEIYQTDLSIRGLFVPKGKNIIEFYNTLF